MDLLLIWISKNYIEIFGAITGIIYVFLEIRQTIWLWPLGIVTSAVYIWVFFASKFYADMSLQVYYLVISILGWYWWVKGIGDRGKGKGKDNESTGHRAEGPGQADGEVSGEMTGVRTEELTVSRIGLRLAMTLAIIFIFLYVSMWLVLANLTDSPVPAWDSFITSLSIIATWMLARKIFEHWYLWIIVNFVSSVLFIVKGLYPTVVLYIIYGVMSFAGLKAWRKSLKDNLSAARK
jgi:nicotinamide mononucleotide transporter